MNMAFEAVYKLKRELDVSPPLLKNWMDKVFFAHVVKKYLPWGGREFGQKEIVCGREFLGAILPFSDIYFESDKSQVMYVAADQVMAGHYRGYQDINMSDLPGLLDMLDSRADEHGHDEQARYNQIGSFPIYRAYEGKNRVDLYRIMERPIKAAVCRAIYPDPERLKLLKVRMLKDCYALEYRLDKEYPIDPKWDTGIIGFERNKVIKVLAFNESIPVLEDYGVEWGQPIFSVKAPIQKKIVRSVVAHRFYRP